MAKIQTKTEDGRQLVAGRAYGPGSTGFRELLFGPGDEITKEQLKILEATDGVEFEPVGPDPSQAQGHRDQLAAEALERLEKTDDPAEAAIVAEQLRNRSERARAGANRAPADFDRAYGENARRMEAAMEESGARSAAQLPNLEKVDTLLTPGSSPSPASSSSAAGSPAMTDADAVDARLGAKATREDLVNVATERGLEVDDKATKAEIRAQLGVDDAGNYL